MCIDSWVENINFFALGNVNGLGGFDTFPNLGWIQLLFAGIRSTAYLNAVCVKKLLRFSTRRSAIPKKHPICFHQFPPFFVICVSQGEGLHTATGLTRTSYCSCPLLSPACPDLSGTCRGFLIPIYRGFIERIGASCPALGIKH